MNPGADEVCDGIDNDCDSLVDGDDGDLPADADGDGGDHCSDCDDEDASIYTGAPGVIDVPLDRASIQDAIDAATAGDIVCVEPGTYSEMLDFGGKAVVVTGPGTAVVDAGGNGTAVSFATSEGPDSELRGMTLRNGHASWGGGIYVLYASPTLTRVVVDGNSASNWGGGLCVAGSGADPTMSRLLVANNHASDGGGGMYMGSGGEATISDSLFYHNDTDGQGGGIHLRSTSHLTLRDVVLDSNTCEAAGAGMHINVGGASTMERVTFSRNLTDYVWGYGAGLSVGVGEVVATDLIFEDNRAEGSNGGGLYLYGTSSSTTIDGATFTGNYTHSDGSAMYIADSEAVLTDLIIEGNEGGAAISYGSYDASTLRNSRVVDNEGDERGGVFFGNYTETLLDNVIVSGNSSLSGAGIMCWAYAEPTIRNSLISGNTAGGYGGGAYIYRAAPTFENVAIVGNSAVSESYGCGGGVHIFDSNSAPTFTNVAIVGNFLEGPMAYGAGICVSDGAATELTNVLIAHNELSLGALVGGLWDEMGSATVTYTDAWGNDGADFEPDVTGYWGNISEDPELLDISAPDPLNWDLHLDTGSNCANAGSFSVDDPDGSRSDIGMYGGPGADLFDLDHDGYGEWWQPGAYDFVSYPGQSLDCDDQDADVYPGNGC